MEQKLRVAVDAKPFGGIDIYIAQGVGDTFSVAKPIELVFEPQEIAHTYEPTLRLGDWFGHELMQALAEALDEQGIKTDKDAKMQGTLEATRYHLEDLRRLLKLKKA